MFNYKPPTPGSSVKQWRRWLRRETEQINFDMTWDALYHAIPTDGLCETPLRKVNGCWRQYPSLGFSEPTQERDVALAQMRKRR